VRCDRRLQGGPWWAIVEKMHSKPLASGRRQRGARACGRSARPKRVGSPPCGSATRRQAATTTAPSTPKWSAGSDAGGRHMPDPQEQLGAYDPLVICRACLAANPACTRCDGYGVIAQHVIGVTPRPWTTRPATAQRALPLVGSGTSPHDAARRPAPADRLSAPSPVRSAAPRSSPGGRSVQTATHGLVQTGERQGARSRRRPTGVSRSVRETRVGWPRVIAFVRRWGSALGGVLPWQQPGEDMIFPRIHPRPGVEG
jgi:hypothetical protein